MLLEFELLSEFTPDSHLFTEIDSKCTEAEVTASAELTEDLQAAYPSATVSSESRSFVIHDFGVKVYYKDQYTVPHLSNIMRNHAVFNHRRNLVMLKCKEQGLKLPYECTTQALRKHMQPHACPRVIPVLGRFFAVGTAYTRLLRVPLTAAHLADVHGPRPRVPSR